MRLWVTYVIMVISVVIPRTSNILLSWDSALCQLQYWDRHRIAIIPFSQSSIDNNLEVFLTEHIPRTKDDEWIFHALVVITSGHMYPRKSRHGHLPHLHYKEPLAEIYDILRDVFVLQSIQAGQYQLR
jgi:hypothetical protein